MNTVAAIADVTAANSDLDAAKVKLASALNHLEASGPSGTVVVEPGANLQSLIANGAAGTTYRLKSAFVCGALTVAKPVTLEHHDLAALPATQIADDAVLPRIMRQLTLDAPTTLRGIGVDGDPAYTADVLVMAVNGEGGLLFDRTRIRGSIAGQRHGMICNVPNVALSKSTITNIWYQDETKALLTERDSNGLFSDNCKFEAGAIPFLAGGATIHSPWRIPKNLRFVDCEFSRPAAWRPLTDGRGNKCKNWFELKAAIGVTVLRGTFKNNWAAGQNGHGLVLSVRNQNAADPWATIEDVFFDDCTADSTAGVLAIMGRDDYLLSPGVSRSDALRRVRFRRLRASNVGSQWSIPGNSPPALMHLFMGSYDVCIEDFQATLGTGTVNANIMFDHPAFLHQRFVAKQWNVPEGTYGTTHAGEGWNAPPPAATPAPPLRGAPTLAHFCPGMTWQDITLRRPSNSGGNWQYPPGTTVVPA